MKNHFHFFTFFLSLLLIQACAFDPLGGTLTGEGRVVDTSGEPLQGVTVTCISYSDTNTVVTDELGRYKVICREGGIVKAEYKKEDYSTQKSTLFNDQLNKSYDDIVLRTISEDAFLQLPTRIYTASPAAGYVVVTIKTNVQLEAKYTANWITISTGFGIFAVYHSANNTGELRTAKVYLESKYTKRDSFEVRQPYQTEVPQLIKKSKL